MAAREAAVPVRLLSSDERLPAVKRNQALREATGDLVVFLNDDVWVGPDFVSTHVAAHAQFTQPIAVLGHVEQSAEMPSTPFIEWFRPLAYDEISDLAGQPVPWRYRWSMNLSLPRQVMLDRNLVFHEDWAEIGHEDVELGYRWAKAGYQTIYVPAARGEHYHPHDLASSCRLQASIGRGLRDLGRWFPSPACTSATAFSPARPPSRDGCGWPPGSFSGSPRHRGPAAAGRLVYRWLGQGQPAEGAAADRGPASGDRRGCGHRESSMCRPRPGLPR